MAWTAPLLLACALAAAAPDDPARLADAYARAVREVNEKHARKPGTAREADLAKQLPASARRALDDLLAAKGPEAGAALRAAADAACDLDLAKDYERIAARLQALDEAAAAEAGVLVSRDRFVVRGEALSRAYCERFADVVEAVLRGYDEVFGFREWSKVPGKKLRFRLHRVPKIERPPHFAPEFPFHSQVDFPVADAEAFRSPTPDGKFLLYGLCHELGHVVSMWGTRTREDDHHTWAHYTGVAIVEHLADRPDAQDALRGLGDAKWRSLSKEREAAADRAPSTADRDGTMALWIALHDSAGPRAIGEAMNAIDAKDRRLRVNRVRYTTFDELRDALLATRLDEKTKRRVRELLP